MPGESQGERSLMEYHQWGHRELDTTEWLSHTYNLLAMFHVAVGLLCPFQSGSLHLLGKMAYMWQSSVIVPNRISRDITLPTKVRLIKTMFVPVVMCRCESWIIKKAEHQRIDVFELWCWRRVLSVPWTARRSNQSILKESSPEYSLEGLLLKLKPIIWPRDVKNWFIWKDPDAGKDWRLEEKGTIEDDMVGWLHQCNGHEFE